MQSMNVLQKCWECEINIDTYWYNTGIIEMYCLVAIVAFVCVWLVFVYAHVCFVHLDNVRHRELQLAQDTFATGDI